jgi:hypothetical protein
MSTLRNRNSAKNGQAVRRCAHSRNRGQTTFSRFLLFEETVVCPSFLPRPTGAARLDASAQRGFDLFLESIISQSEIAVGSLTDLVDHVGGHPLPN